MKEILSFWNSYTSWLKSETHFFFIKHISRFWTIVIGIAFFSWLSIFGGGSFFESITGTMVWAFVLTLIAFIWQRRKENTAIKVVNKTATVLQKVLVYGFLSILAFLIFILIVMPKT